MVLKIASENWVES